MIDIQIAAVVGIDRLGGKLAHYPLDWLHDVKQVELVKTVVGQAEKLRLARTQRRRCAPSRVGTPRGRRLAIPAGADAVGEKEDVHDVTVRRMTSQCAAGTKDFVIRMRNDGEDARARITHEQTL